MPNHEYTHNYEGAHHQVQKRDLVKAFGLDFAKELAGLDPEEAQQREAVVREALSWIGTEYVSGGDVKGAGVDCGMLLVRVYVDTGLCPPFDPRPYPEQWHLHQAAEKYMELVAHFATEVAPPPDRPSLPGDIVLFLYGKVYSHGGIVMRGDEIIHVSRPNPVQLEQVCRSGMLNALKKSYFSVWPLRYSPDPGKALLDYTPENI